MGVYDILPKGGQVKCWKNKMKQLDVGSKVGKLDGHRSYIVLLREGGYVRVRKGKIREIVEDGVKYLIVNIIPLVIFDKYGNVIDHTDGLKGPLGEDYYY